MRRLLGWLRCIYRKACCLVGANEWGCAHRAQRGFCFLLVMGPTGALLLFLLGWTVKGQHPDAAGYTRLARSNAEGGGRMAELVSCAGPRAELVSGALSPERLALGTAPLSGRLVWRPESSKSSASQEMSSNRDQALWVIPDLYVDSWSTWTLCPVVTVLVLTTPRRRAQRDAIRTTWGRSSQYPNCSLRVVFFMSTKQELEQLGVLKRKHGREPSLFSYTRAEYRQFHDMVVQLEAPGVTQAASAMAALLVEWIPAHMDGSQFALRVTDDTHVHVHALLSTLSSRAEASAAGFIFGRASRNKEHLEGCVYMAKSEAFLRLQPMFADENLDEREDSFITGRLARKAGLVAVHLEGIGPCDDREAAAELERLFTSGNVFSEHLTIRGLSPEQMALLHSSISSFNRALPPFSTPRR